MKKMKYVVLVTGIWMLQASCDSESPIFDAPMPQGKSELKYFPRKLQGHYESIDEKSILTITNSMMYATYDYDFIEPKDTTDKTFTYTENAVYSRTHSAALTQLKYKGDSVAGHYHKTDTLFVISETNVLKKFKGYYFLNRKDDDSWNVQKLWLQKGKLKTGTIDNTKDLALLNTITEQRDDTTTTPYHLHRKQFVKLVKEGFSSVTSYTRLPGKL